MMLNLMDLRKDIEEQYGVVKEFYGSDVYHYSISHGKKMFGCGASVLDEQSLFQVLGKYMKSVNVQLRLF